MSEVYIVEQCDRYEGTSVRGVYESYAAAAAACRPVLLGRSLTWCISRYVVGAALIRGYEMEFWQSDETTGVFKHFPASIRQPTSEVRP